MIRRRSWETLHWSTAHLIVKTARIDCINRIIPDIHIKVRLPTFKPDRILIRPPPGARIIIALSVVRKIYQ